MNQSNLTKIATMSKKHNSNPHERPRLVSVERKQREPQPSERASFRAATVAQDQRETRARREAAALLEREDARRDAIARAGAAPAPTVREEFQATRRLPLDAPMATRDGLPDPMGQMWADPDQDYSIPMPPPVMGRMLLTGFSFLIGLLTGLMVGRGA